MKFVPRQVLTLFTVLCGLVFVYTLTVNEPLAFQHLPPPFPATSFENRRGFFNVLRWMESLRTPKELEMLVQMAIPMTSQEQTDPSQSAMVLTQLAQAWKMDLYVQISKLPLQCGLLLFLHRLQLLSKTRVTPTICLCVLVLLCWQMAQSCLQDTLKNVQRPESRRHAVSMDLRAAFLNTLFVLRYVSMAISSAIIGRAYHVYFCPKWPDQWKRVPQYLGSKDLMLSTLFYATASVSFMSVTSTTLRSLTEATHQIESLALAGAWLHFLSFHLPNDDKKPKAEKIL